MIQKDGMELRIGGAESVKENDSISLHERSDVKNVDLGECSALVSMTLLNDELTRMASLRIRIVGTRFGTLESILRKSRGCHFNLHVNNLGGHIGDIMRPRDLRLDDAQHIDRIS